MTVQQDISTTNYPGADMDARTLRRMERVLRWLS